MTYTVRLVSGAKIAGDEKLKWYIENAAAECNIRYGSEFDWYDFDLENYATTQPLFVCFRDEEPVGFLGASLTTSVFDKNLRILKQLLLYATPGTRASFHLLKAYIDFGKNNADHILTVIGSETNIKPQSIERLGFKKLETTYRIEVK